jgi:hypothetical protein
VAKKILWNEEAVKQRADGECGKIEGAASD